MRANVDAAVRRHRAERVLRRERVPDRTHGDDVEREPERPRDLGHHLDPAAGEPDDDCVAKGLVAERARELPAGPGAIGEGDDLFVSHGSSMRGEGFARMEPTRTGSRETASPAACGPAERDPRGAAGVRRRFPSPPGGTSA